MKMLVTVFLKEATLRRKNQTFQWTNMDGMSRAVFHLTVMLPFMKEEMEKIVTDKREEKKLLWMLPTEDIFLRV